MKLKKTTPANLFKIRTPVWGGRQRKVGLAAYKIGLHNEIRIEAKDKEGVLIHPNPYYLSGNKAKSYPTQPVKSAPHIILHMVPVDDLEYWRESDGSNSKSFCEQCRN